MHTYVLAAVALVLAHAVAAVEVTQVVFVHGFLGFGSDELFGLNYWGFKGAPLPIPWDYTDGNDYLKIFRDSGYTAYYASVGPFSSNHDRACELYAQIKGKLVDYGPVHSARFGHARFGKDYTGKGFYPAWSSSNKMHLVGHSMGGSTVRYLEYLLQKGIAEEYNGIPSTEAGKEDSLFRPAKPAGGNWIQSVHAISAVLDGSTLIEKLGLSVNFIRNFVGVFAALLGLTTIDELVFDFDLGHFGLNRGASETFSAYFTRVLALPMFTNGFKDLSSYDLGVMATHAFNKKTELAYPQTYYFSYSTSHTFTCGWFDQCPDIDMELLMSATGLLLGDMDGVCAPYLDGVTTGCLAFDNSWEANDGLVPARSSQSPRIGLPWYNAPSQWTSDGYCVYHWFFAPFCPYLSTWQNEIWNLDSPWYPGTRWYTKHYERDHIQIIGFRLNYLETNPTGGLYKFMRDVMNRVRTQTAAAEVGSAMVGTVEGAAQPAMDETAAIVGGVVGGVAVVALLVGAAVLVRRRRRSSTTSPASPMVSSPRRAFLKKPTAAVLNFDDAVSPAQSPIDLSNRAPTDV